MSTLDIYESKIVVIANSFRILSFRLFGTTNPTDTSSWINIQTDRWIMRYNQ